MTQDQQQKNLNREHYSEMLREIEEIDPEVIHALVPGSRLHAFINSSDESIDED